MSIQLFLAGIFLNFTFNLNNGFLNLAWIGLMIFFASYTTIKKY
jgi:putative ABC transport system permease protein